VACWFIIVLECSPNQHTHIAPSLTPSSLCALSTGPAVSSSHWPVGPSHRGQRVPGSAEKHGAAHPGTGIHTQTMGGGALHTAPSSSPPGAMLSASHVASSNKQKQKPAYRIIWSLSSPGAAYDRRSVPRSTCPARQSPFSCTSIYTSTLQFEISDGCMISKVVLNIFHMWTQTVSV